MLKLNKKASTLVLVIVFITGLSVISATIFLRYRTQKQAIVQIDDHLKADWIAKGLVQLMLFKIKLIPSAFYLTDELHKNGTSISGANIFIESWYKDFYTLSGYSVPLQGELANLASTYLGEIPDRTKNTYKAWIRKCTILEKSPGGYDKDLLRVGVEVKINNRTRQYEELVEINRYGL